jgi:hypothetical protein
LQERVDDLEREVEKLEKERRHRLFVEKCLREALMDYADGMDVMCFKDGDLKTAVSVGSLLDGKRFLVDLNDMPEEPEPVKKERSARLQALGDRLMADYHRLHLGTEQRVLVEEQENGLWTGYTNDYTKAFIRSDEDLHDQFVTGAVVDADESGIIVIR